MAAAPLRVGSVPYLVGRPLDWGLESAAGIDYHRAVPAELIRGLRAAELDVALVSSIELFRQPGYRYLDRWVIAGRARVSSVQLFLRRPLAQLRSLAFDPASRSSQALVEVLLAEQHYQSHEVPLGSDPRAADCDAWLRIGDRALQESAERPALDFFNPSEQWSLRTGLPFVFAAWIVRPGVAIEAQHLQAFEQAAARGRARAEAMARAAAAPLGLAEEFVVEYLTRECCFELPSAELSAALKRFAGAVAQRGKAREDLDPQPLML